MDSTPAHAPGPVTTRSSDTITTRPSDTDTSRQPDVRTPRPPAPGTPRPPGGRETSALSARDSSRPSGTEVAAALVEHLRPLLAAEAAAEAPAAGAEPGDLEQAVWLRLLERLHTSGAPHDPARWLRRAVRSEARRTRRVIRRSFPSPVEPADASWRGTEPQVVAALRRRALRAAVRRLPGRCATLVTALLSPQDLTYREIAGELGISQGSLGPERSRCLGCLRRMLGAEVAVQVPRGKH